MQIVLDAALTLDENFTIQPGSYTVSEIAMGGIPFIVLKISSGAFGYLVSDTSENMAALGLNKG